MVTYTGGCLCRAVRYEAIGKPRAQGYCFCGDCRKASGSGFVPFLMFAAASFSLTGELTQSVVKSFRDVDAVRNRCAKCGSLVFGGILGESTFFSIYGGSLDEPALFQPAMAIFTRDKPDWVLIPPGLQAFETLPET